MGALTVRMLEGIVRYDRGARPGTPLEFRELVNLAGEQLVQMAPWKFLEGRQAVLRIRAAITIENATWVEGTLTLTKIGAFTDYVFLSGDTIEITGGTGATVGTYEIASRTNNDTIVLASSIGAAASGIGDTDAFMRNDQVELPSDLGFQQVIGWSLSNGLVGSFEFTTAQGMLDLRTWPGLTTTISFWALINWIRTGVGGQPVPRLDTWPPANENAERIVLFYRGGWIEPAEDTTVLEIPNFVNGLFIELVKAVAAGYEDPEEGEVADRVLKVQQGSLFMNAIATDAMIQPTLGPMMNTWLEAERPDWRERFSTYRSPVA